MGRIKKSATDKHDMALSPYIADFVNQTTAEPLHKIPAHLATFPQIWTFPRGDLYHWIPVLNRFDHILELFVAEYSLGNGPQTKKFGDTLLKKGDASQDNGLTSDHLREAGFSTEGDRELVQSILRFSLILLEHNGNRSLYSSSEHLNSLLNTTSLPLLKANLHLCLGLAQRYWSSKSRMTSSHHLGALLQSHYNINLDKIQAICDPLAKTIKPYSHYDAISGRPTQKDSSAPQACNPSDLNLFLKSKELPENVRQAIGDINFTFYDRTNTAEPALSQGAVAASPSSPTPVRRTPTSGPGANIVDSPTAEKHERSSYHESSNGPKILQIPGQNVVDSSPEAVVSDNLCNLPADYHYEFLQQVRIAQGFRGSKRDLQDLICIRMYALANLSYVYGDTTFHVRIGQPDNEHPRDFQVANQLADLLQPNSDGTDTVPLEISIAAVTALEALSKAKAKTNDVASALNISVSHGILFYILRKVLAGLDSDDVDAEQFRWREAVFTLVTSVAAPPHSYHRNTDQMVAAGLIGVLIQGLTLRSANAEPHYGNILHFFDTFIHNGVRDAFQSLINGRGLEVIADLTAFEVQSALEAVAAGQGLPGSYKTKVTDYQIPFYKQQALRRIVKFIQNLFSHNVGGGERHLRNLIDSPQLLGALKSIIGNAKVFGSNVWIGAVNIISSFIHSEPTSYNVIHEAGLSNGILEAIAPSNSQGIPAPDSILPVGETLRDIPPAFGAICLNESGKALFQKSQVVDAFLGIFTSLDHVKVMEDDGDCAISIGNSFDELVRHHPELKDQVHESIMRMMGSVVAHCQDRAKQKGVGAKLWVPGEDDDTIYVAGGRQATAGSKLDSPLDVDEEVEPLAEKDVETDNLVSGHTSGKSTSDVISVISKFLQGYLSNNSMLTRFCEAGGIAYLLDMAMCPCNPWNLHDLSTYDELARVFLQVVESKPHMVLPSLVNRTKQALLFLRPMLDHSSSEANSADPYFRPWTSFETSTSAEQNKRLRSGTRIVKGLVAVQTLINLLADIFQSQAYYSQRPSYPNYFSQINLTDYYVILVDSLGRLHTACIWEEIHLQINMPAEWREATRVKGTGFNNAEADMVMGQITTSESSSQATRNVASNTDVMSETQPGTTTISQQAASTSDQEPSTEHPAAFRNTEILRYLFSQIPTGVLYFFQQLGKSLFSKSRGMLDSYGKQNATLVAQHLAQAMIAQLQFPVEKVLPGPVEWARYEIVVLSSIVKILIDKRNFRSGQPDILLVVLNQFYQQGGFKELNKSLGKWFAFKRRSDKDAESTDIMDCATAGASMILDFYARITSSKTIQDSLQASSLSSHTSDPSSPHYLDASQLLVELRDAVILSVMDIWGDKFYGDGETAAVCMDSDSIRSVISVLRSTLEADGEHRAFSRDNVRPRVTSPRRRWRLRNEESIQTLVQNLVDGGASQDLAIEALFRCYEGLNMASEYIRMRQAQGPHATERLPPPPEELEELRESRQTTSSASAQLPVSGTSPLDRVPSVEMRDADADANADESDQHRDDTDDPMSDVDASNGPGSANSMLNNLASRTSGSLYIGASLEEDARGNVSELPTQSRPQPGAEEQRPQTITREDLDEKRKIVREDLVDRCLEFLNEHPDLSFDIADLVSSATASRDPESKELKSSFGETLTLTLVSLQSDDASRQHRKIAAVAHLLALVLQDKDFFDASIESLKNSFDEFVQLLKVSSETNLEEATEYIINILLVLERVLVEDEQPHQISWTGPSSDVTQDQTPILLPPPLIEQQLKDNLFNAILDLLPRVGKNEVFALSVTRVLVILTRRRTVAKRLSAKPNLGRLFLMLKQLSGMTNEKLQASFMIVLRHMIEDEQIIRQIMRTEIPIAFENNRSSRPLDTTTYVRNLYHLVIRDPEIFVEVTNEKVKINRLESTSRPSTLALKREEEMSTSQGIPREEAIQSTEQPAESSRAPLERTKTSEMKPPTVENPDGVIQFLLKELSSYRDVEDKEVAALPRSQSDQPGTPDIEMMDTATPPPDSAAFPTPPLPTPKANERTFFNTGEHPIFTYRCHLLQCLVELLSSYNHTKVEFINFSSKNESFINTPSKPRSGFLNYLLTNLIPVGTLAHSEDTTLKKKLATANWATSVVVALCTRTHERAAKYSELGSDNLFEEEADLVYVRKFVLEQGLKAFNSAMHSTETLDLRYSRLLGLSELFNRMLSSKANGVNNAHSSDIVMSSAKQLGRLMYEKNFVSALTASIAEIDLNFPNARRVIKYILRPLQWLTSVAVEFSLSSDSTLPDTTDDDEISSATSVSEDENQRHATPDIFRNSTLGQFEAGREEESDSSEEEDDEEEEDYYGDEYDEDEMEYEDERPIPDHGDVVSDEDEEIGGMGPIEGVPGDVGMDVEIVMDGDSEDGSGSDSEDDDDDDDDEDDDGDDDVEILDEISGDDENDHGEEYDHEEEWEDDDDDDDDHFDHGGVPSAVMAAIRGSHDEDDSPRSGRTGRRRPLDALARVIGHDDGSTLMARLESAGIPMDDAEMEGEFFDDEMPPEDEDDEDAEDFDEEIVYEPEPEFDDEEDMGEGGWGWSSSAPAPFFRHHHHHHARIPPDPWNSRDAPIEAYTTLRSHRGAGTGRGADDGVNPLLQRGDNRSGSGLRSDRAWSDTLFAEYTGSRMPGRTIGRPGEMPSFMADLLQMVGPPGAARVNIITDRDSFPGGFPPFLLGAGSAQLRGTRPSALSTIFRGFRAQDGPLPTRPPTHDPGAAISFVPCLTSNRWQDEARILFGQNHLDKTQRVVNSIMRLLTPPAIEAKRQRDKADAERKIADEKAREERERKEEAERKEREEVARKEREEHEAREAEEAAQRTQESDDQLEPAANPLMEGVEGNQTAVEHNAIEPPEPAERITAIVRGSEVDITNLGIDPAFLEEIPEDLREEVIMQQLQSRVTQQGEAAAAASQVPDVIDRDFLNILPAHIQQELLRAEASQRNRRDREARRAARAEDQAPQAEEMNNADFMAMLDPALRQSVLLEAGEDVLSALPEEFRAEAQALFDAPSGHISRLQDIVSGRPRERRQPASQQQQQEQQQQQRQRRPVVQILDKAGVATLMRLMFVVLLGTARTAMLAILSDICKNTQTRAEVISILLSILQDGSSDSIALDKSFTQLTVRAKQLTGPKTPQPLRRTLTGSHVSTPNTDASPLTIVQQSLNTLTSLAHDNPRIATFFLTEHDTISNQRTKTPKKGKGKEAKTHRYPVNALLSLLDRRTIMENASAIDCLANLLVRITEPLKALIRRAKEEEKKDRDQAQTTTSGEPIETSSSDNPPTEGQQSDKQELVKDNADDKKKPRDALPPEIPEENLCLVVNIIAARECSGKTFQNTLDIINHLSAIPGARDIFGRELVRRAQVLGAEVLEDLQQLPQQIKNAQTSTEMQGLALGAFSPAGSHQNKLLRILLALDYIFDPKRTQDRSSASTLGVLPQKAKEDLVSSLYDNETFIRLWTMLSDCLFAIRERGTMNNVATILQPLVEAFMVVCKNTAPKEVPVASPQEMTASTPPPQNRIESLFFNFTEEHRKILNDLVRQNPKLMSGTFDVLVKNSKVLEFDNKRNFFNKRLHTRSPEERIPHQSLQLGVRRSQVFLDSFKALFFKKPNEIKYGKLNIRFADEEGVDAGGVTREWFAALSRQMFDPNYALFNPVASDRTTFHPNPLSAINEQHLTFFKFVGRIIGKALYEGRVLDCHFSRAVYKRILGKSVSLKDMETLDLDYYKSLVWMLENDITDVAFETFSVEVDRFGEAQIVDLVPDGRNIPVTEENKQEYVRLVVEQRLTKSVEEQLEHFLIGFREIVPMELISIFNEQELELLISGLPDIDVEDWRNNTEYHNYTPTSPQVQWFWRAVRSFDKEEKAKLLQFVTGTSKVPLNGFKELEGMNGYNRFNIHRDFGHKERLPTSHTCFNQLDLPEYESYEILRKQIYTAITVGSDYFGFA